LIVFGLHIYDAEQIILLQQIKT